MKNTVAKILFGSMAVCAMTVGAGNATAVTDWWENEDLGGLNSHLEEWDSVQEQQMPIDPCLSSDGVNLCTSY